MTTLTANPTPSLAQILASIAPQKRGFDLFGFGLGYRAYQTYTHLSAMSDSQLNSLGLKRAELAGVAMDSVSNR
ncbi:DUF1127 domain-containing protein [Puniceibacterium sp. IMCC21224]|uniref:DUF1127 domain-containing protein n=1 Tax=Puniceibacterium sp. IMCC21224 TaxID=1618204 RepID=UPI00064D8BC1|nr:DUF1127 domain-containing protein [Puniceibacterium sp. IMCC21224]KMK65029.1 protein of unknown function (DUF1127) [Puniceibacterium sp. IMCC21224]